MKNKNIIIHSLEEYKEYLNTCWECGYEGQTRFWGTGLPLCDKCYKKYNERFKQILNNEKPDKVKNIKQEEKQENLFGWE